MFAWILVLMLALQAAGATLDESLFEAARAGDTARLESSSIGVPMSMPGRATA